MVAIESINEVNLNEVLPLIRMYQEFYEVIDISEDVNRRFFLQFGENSPLGCQFAYRRDRCFLGFATVYFSYSSIATGKIAILNDLFTMPEARGQGIGRALIERARAYAASHGATRLQWLTAPDNAQAQLLYNSLETKNTLWRLYTYAV